MTALRWETEREGVSYVAYSGELDIGFVTSLPNGSWAYNLSAVHTRHICKGRGRVKTLEQGKRSLERAWSQWLAEASLQPTLTTPPKSP